MRNEDLQMFLIAVPIRLLSEAGIHPKAPFSMHADEGKIIISNDCFEDYVCDGDCENCPMGDIDCNGECESCPCVDMCENAEVIGYD